MENLKTAIRQKAQGLTKGGEVDGDETGSGTKNLKQEGEASRVTGK